MNTYLLEVPPGIPVLWAFGYRTKEGELFIVKCEGDDYQTSKSCFLKNFPDVEIFYEQQIPNNIFESWDLSYLFGD